MSGRPIPTPAQTADLLTDRTLISSARSIAENIHESDGVIQAPIPPSALEMFATDDRDRVIYRVNGPRGELIAGSPDTLPRTADADQFPACLFPGQLTGASRARGRPRPARGLRHRQQRRGAGDRRPDAAQPRQAGEQPVAEGAARRGTAGRRGRHPRRCSACGAA